MEIRKTTLADIPEIMEIYTIARSFMCKTGNPTQWAGGYPKEELIRKDIASGDSYVAVENGRIEVVFFYRKGEDPTYKVRMEPGLMMSRMRCCIGSHPVVM